ncbi:succinate dehydrogenase assembly factor 2 [Crenothrix polyspora]|jgi:antitoxin CptB|uniref:FAD assembly factor SdhE n=1 Tax=Crenothrix polyspora TaxID=360316 RepID=A0A1R4H3L6_9GAMM|nr:succinate dehydrogenase assembly factor 2 [Crenothrix polyspora]SJM90767.1 conserved hypothetical protein [Crenothrix polyspora]
MRELAKLRWQCRRGTLELDILLTRYLDRYYQSATHDEKAQFIELLSAEDDVLLALLITGTLPLPPNMHGLIQKIHHL